MIRGSAVSRHYSETERENKNARDECFIGLSGRTITPPFVTALYPLDYEERNSREVLDDIHVRALYLEANEALIVITLDLIWVSQEICDQIASWIQGKYNI